MPLLPDSQSSQKKICQDCKRIKPISEFFRNKNGKFYSYCKDCNRRHCKESHQRRKRRINNPPAAEKRCPDCGQTKPGSEFYKAAIGKDGLHYCCKACCKARSQKQAKAIRASDPVPVPSGHKRCWRCKEIKPVSEYCVNKARKDHLDSTCKPCAKIIGRRYYLKRTYGISSKQYRDLLHQQGEVCAICQKPETVIHFGKNPRLSVDHDHKTKAVRGLLCYRCNHLVGFIERFGTDGLDKAQAYLRGHSS